MVKKSAKKVVNTVIPERMTRNVRGSRESSLNVHHVRLIDYRMPLKRAYGTARGVTKASTNFVVEVHARHDGGGVVGLGEGQPRHRLSGDVDVDTAWKFSSSAAQLLPGEQISLDSQEKSLDDVRRIMARLRHHAVESSSERNRNKPFRGSLLGFEVALLDSVAQALGISISDLLGEERDDVAVTVSTLSTQNTTEEFREKIAKQAHRYPMVRAKGSGDLTADSELMKLIHVANVEAGDPKPLWIDFNEGFDPEQAKIFIDRAVDAMAMGELPALLTLEQPVPHSAREQLPILQRHADSLTSGRGVGDIRIMPDESLWDVEDLEWLHQRGGCRAINIKTAKAGGLLASLDLARRAVALNPNTAICIGGMVGTSDITTWSLTNLAKSLPRLDYITATPPWNRRERITAPKARLAKGTNVHVPSHRAGLGTKLVSEKIGPFMSRESWFPNRPEEDVPGVALHAGSSGSDGGAIALLSAEPSNLEEAIEASLRADRHVQKLIDVHMKPRKWKTEVASKREELQVLLDKVNPVQVSYMGLRRIERQNLSVGRGLSFRAKMMEAAESRTLGVHRPTWLLDDKAAAYHFVDSLGISRPHSDGVIHKFKDIEEQYPCVVKSTRSTGSRGCYLVYKPGHIVHVYDSAQLSSWGDMAQHAERLMDESAPGHTLKDKWIVEELVLDPGSDSRPARDVKYFCFYGEVLLVLEMHRENGREYCFLNPDNTPADTGRNLKYFEGEGTTTEELNVIQRISRQIPFPFVRIDMLRGADGIVFGEFTPRIGYYTDFNDFWDRKMGEAWVKAQSRLLEDMLRGKRFDAFLNATRMLEK